MHTPATTTHPRLVEILHLGPTASNALRIGYWRSAFECDDGGPYVSEVRSVQTMLDNFRAGQYRLDGRFAYVANRMISVNDVHGIPQDMCDALDAGDHKLIDTLYDADTRTITPADIERHLTAQLERAEAQRNAWSMLPWPGDHVDPSMPVERREVIVAALRSHPIVVRYCGNSPSRLSPGVTCGGCERSNGAYVWPVGLEHYVLDHGLVLDPTFLTSIGA